MNAPLLNIARAQRGILPPDGECKCDRCGKAGLDREQIHTVRPESAFAVYAGQIGETFCEYCLDLIWLEHEAAESPAPKAKAHNCSHCNGGSVSSQYDYARGKQHIEFCEYCNGYGHEARYAQEGSAWA